MYEDIFFGITSADPSELLVPMIGEHHREMVLIKDIAFHSVCEHHLLPFAGKAHVAYIPSEEGYIAGLSKLARLVKMVAARPQLQERITSTGRRCDDERPPARGRCVLIEAEHLCMTMRGVRTPGARTVTSAVRGIMEAHAATRAEVLSLINAGR